MIQTQSWRVMSAGLTVAVVIACGLFGVGAAHATVQTYGFGINITSVTGTGTHTLTWHGNYTCGHSGAHLRITAIDQPGLAVAITNQSLTCSEYPPTIDAPIEGTIAAPLFLNWANSVRIVAEMDNLSHPLTVPALDTVTVQNDVAEVLTVDTFVRTSSHSMTYYGRFSCHNANATTNVSIAATQVPDGGTPLGLSADDFTCPATPGTLAPWELTVSSLTPFGQRGTVVNAYALHLDTLSGKDNEKCLDDGDDEPDDDCDDGETN